MVYIEVVPSLVHANRCAWLSLHRRICMGQVIDSAWRTLLRTQWEYSRVWKFELFAIFYLYLIPGLFL